MKKGFTLAELLGVIVILGALALITIPTVDNTIKRNKERLQKEQKQIIISNINNYLALNSYKLSLHKNWVIYASILDLANNGLGRYEYKDPITGKYLDYYQPIIITKSDGDISFNIDNLYDNTNLLDEMLNTVCKASKSNINYNNKDNVTVTCGSTNTSVTITSINTTNNDLQEVYISSISKKIYINNLKEI